MYNFFINLCASILLIGLALFGLSFFTDLSHWIGIEMVKGSVFLFIIGLFFVMLENDFTKEKGQA